ncbi:GIMA4 GTPase, partial [Amia calva]|nr:GIMA4 GTPase [Amia calva]
MRIVLLGGGESVGDSSAGNTILGREQFKTGDVSETVTLNCQGEIARQLTVVDTPGWWGSVQQNPEWVTEEIMRSVSLCPPGPNALLLNIPVWLFFTEIDRRAVQEHLELFGDKVWKHTIVLFTGADCLRNRTIEQHIENKGKELQWLIKKCGNRHHVLNNRMMDNRNQVKELLQKIEEMVAGNKGRYYDTEMFPKKKEIIKPKGSLDQIGKQHEKKESTREEELKEKMRKTLKEEQLKKETDKSTLPVKRRSRKTPLIPPSSPPPPLPPYSESDLYSITV